MESKNILQSKTFWTNIVLLPLLPVLVDHVLPALKDSMSVSVYLAVSAAANILLRCLTTQPVSIVPNGANNNA